MSDRDEKYKKVVDLEPHEYDMKVNPMDYDDYLRTTKPYIITTIVLAYPVYWLVSSLLGPVLDRLFVLLGV